MVEAIELQVISRIITTEDPSEAATLLSYGGEFYSMFTKEIEYIQAHYNKYSMIPSRFDFMAQFPNFTFVVVTEPLEYLEKRLKEHRKQILLIETFNNIKDLGSGDVDQAWMYLSGQCEKAESYTEAKPMDIVQEAERRANQILEFNKQKRIPTGFDELDKLMYGGLSTVEELFVIIARSNAGKSWTCTKMMESAQKHGFPVAYYSPEMQSAYLATRFDTWRNHFQNSSLYRGDYSAEYYAYIKSLPQEETSAYVIEDKDFPEGVSVKRLKTFVRQHGIKLLIVDGISYMVDDFKATRDQEKYKNIATGLFSLSKQFGCAVVLVMQSNRDVRNKDDKGESIPDLYNAENSDAPGRVATQAIGLRQIFDKHVLDMKLLKSRMAVNSGQVLSYAWDVNTGNMQYLAGGADGTDVPAPTIPSVPTVSAAQVISGQPAENSSSLVQDDEDIEF